MRWRVLTFVSLLLATPSCSRCGGGESGAGAGAVPSGSTSASADGSGGADACVAVGPAQRFAVGEVQDGAGPMPFAAEVGSAALDDAGWLVGVRSPGALGALGDAKVLRLAADGGSMHVVASWLPAAGAARAPKIATGAGVSPIVVLTAAMGDRRTVKLARLVENKLVDLATLPAEADESEAVAAIPTREGALVAWDDSDDAGSNGHVRLRAVQAGAAPAASASAPASASAAASAPAPVSPPAASAKRPAATLPTDAVSPATSDASFPVLVSVSDTRAVLLWLAERPDATESPDGGAGEPSQQESYRWIEAVVIDVARARPIGAPIALTPKDGHAQTFSAQLVGEAIYVAVRDDARPTDGDGGSIYVVSASLPPATDAAGTLGAPRTLTRVSDGVSAGLPMLVLDTRPWLFWLGPDDDARLVPASTMPGPSATKSPSLDARRVVAQGKGVLLTSRLVGAGIELALRRCALR